MRDVVYADELSDELKKVLHTLDVDYYICKTRKLSATDLIEELVSRYEEWIGDKDKEIEKLRASLKGSMEHNCFMASEREKAWKERDELKRKLRELCEEYC